MKSSDKRSSAKTAVRQGSPTGTVPKLRDVSSPSREEIATRAYEIYLQRGAAPGRELEDWLQAERELEQARMVSRRTA